MGIRSVWEGVFLSRRLWFLVRTLPECYFRNTQSGKFKTCGKNAGKQSVYWIQTFLHFLRLRICTSSFRVKLAKIGLNWARNIATQLSWMVLLLVFSVIFLNSRDRQKPYRALVQEYRCSNTWCLFQRTDYLWIPFLYRRRSTLELMNSKHHYPKNCGSTFLNMQMLSLSVTIYTCIWKAQN